MTPTTYHQHVIVRAQITKPPGPNDTAAVETWMADLISKLNMKIMFGPVAMHCAVPGNTGTTCFSIIETSHLVWHDWTELDQPVAQLDVYSCSQLDLNVVFEALKVFEPVAMDYKFLDREHDLKLISEGFIDLTGGQPQ